MQPQPPGVAIPVQPTELAADAALRALYRQEFERAARLSRHRLRIALRCSERTRLVDRLALTLWEPVFHAMRACGVRVAAGRRLWAQRAVPPLRYRSAVSHAKMKTSRGASRIRSAVSASEMWDCGLRVSPSRAHARRMRTLRPGQSSSSRSRCWTAAFLPATIQLFARLHDKKLAGTDRARIGCHCCKVLRNATARGISASATPSFISNRT